MRLVIIPDIDQPSPETEPVETPAADERGTADSAFRWWLPFTCRAKNYVQIDGSMIAGRCGSRGCLDCYPRKLRQWTQTAMTVKRKRGEQMYGLVITDTKVKTRQDVDLFLKRVRKVMKAWERSSAGLGAAWWVAECTIDWEAPPTEIPCPVSCSPLPEEATKEYSQHSQRVLHGISGGHGHAPTPEIPFQCPYCRGRGLLPSVHLHAHVAALSSPFWYGEGSPTKGLSFPQTFGGRGYRGLLDEYGLGFSSVEIIHKRRGLQEYMAKGMLTYMSKGARVKTGEHKAGRVDWEVSALDLLVAHAIYGGKRARGTNGRAYGVKRRIKNTSLDVSYGGKMNGYGRWIQDVDQSAALLSMCGEYTDVKHQESDFIEPLQVAMVDVIELGKRVVQSGAAGIAALKVLNKTQVDTPLSAVLSPTFRTFNEYGEEQTNTVKLGKNDLFTSGWRTAYVVRSGQWWTLQTSMGKILGRGGSGIHIRGAQNKDLQQCINYIKVAPFMLWRECIEDTEQGLLNTTMLDAWKEENAMPALPQLAAK